MEARAKVKAILLLFAIAFVLVTDGVGATSDSLRFEVLLTRKIALDNSISQKFVNSLDITTPDHLILLSTANQYYLLGWGGITPVGKKVTGKINSFAFTGDNLLMTIRDKELCSFDSLGQLSPIFKLPVESMGISAGGHVMYLYNQKPGLKRNALYLIARGRKYEKLLELATPFQSVAEAGNSILFSTQNGLFQYDLRSKNLKAVAVLPEDQEIQSLAVDTMTGRIYFSSKNSIYTLKDTSILLLTDKLSGSLKYFDDGLIVFNTNENYLIRITGLEDKIKTGVPAAKPVAKAQPKVDTLTNTSIVNMVQAKLSEEMIINIINKSQVNFNMTVDSMIYLSNQNVPSGVIRAMKAAMKRKSEGAPNEIKN